MIASVSVCCLLKINPTLPLCPIQELSEILILQKRD